MKKQERALKKIAAFSHITKTDADEPVKGKKRAAPAKKGKKAAKKKGGKTKGKKGIDEDSGDDVIGSDDSLNDFIAGDDEEIEAPKKNRRR
mgnify:CR=1 FL=1